MAEQAKQEGIRVPMSRPDLTEAEVAAVSQVLRTPYLSMGPEVEAFERAVADYVGAKHGIAVNSGTAGLHLCVRAAGIRDGDLVITTPFSFVASANVLLYERALPIFVDVDPTSGNIDPQAVQAAIDDITAGGKARSRRLPRRGAERTGELKGLLPVDVFGQPADYGRLEPLAQSAGLPLIEDSCEALGARYQARPAGTFGDAGVFAFYPNKQMTTGEGGVIVTERDDWAEVARALRNQGRAPGDTWLDHSFLGYNYRLNELNAALGRVQLGRIEELLASRGRVAERYRQLLAEVEGATAPAVLETTDRMSWFVYVVRLDPGLERRKVAEGLAAEGVPTRPYFRPIHLQTYFVDRFGFEPGDFPAAEDLARRSLALPFSSVMTDQEIGWVVEALDGVLRRMGAGA